MATLEELCQQVEAADKCQHKFYSHITYPVDPDSTYEQDPTGGYEGPIEKPSEEVMELLEKILQKRERGLGAYTRFLGGLRALLLEDLANDDDGYWAVSRCLIW